MNFFAKRNAHIIRYPDSTGKSKSSESPAEVLKTRPLLISELSHYGRLDT